MQKNNLFFQNLSKRALRVCCTTRIRVLCIPKTVKIYLIWVNCELQFRLRNKPIYFFYSFCVIKRFFQIGRLMIGISRFLTIQIGSFIALFKKKFYRVMQVDLQNAITKDKCTRI